jgi:hypothetical protein
VVAGAEGSRDVVASDESEARPVARRLMLFRGVLKVVPQVVGERVFLRRVGVESRFLGQFFLSQFARPAAAADVLPKGGKDRITFRHD